MSKDAEKHQFMTKKAAIRIKPPDYQLSAINKTENQTVSDSTYIHNNSTPKSLLAHRLTTQRCGYTLKLKM